MASSPPAEPLSATSLPSESSRKTRPPSVDDWKIISSARALKSTMSPTTPKCDGRVIATVGKEVSGSICDVEKWGVREEGGKGAWYQPSSAEDMCVLMDIT